MKLLELPADILRTILHTLDPESFFVCLQTSKLLREHALNSNALLHEQLSQIPGRKYFPEAYADDTPALLKLFSRRATKHLKNGAAQRTDVNIWRPAPDTDGKTSFITHLWVDVQTQEKKDSFGVSLVFSRMVFVQVNKHDATIQIYLIKYQLMGQTGSAPQLWQVIHPQPLTEYFPTLRDGRAPEIEVVKATPYTPREVPDDPWSVNHYLAVLYRMKSQCTCCAPSHEHLMVIVFRFVDSFGPMVEKAFNVRAQKGFEVVDMAISSDCVPVIVYRRRHGQDSTQHLVAAYWEDNEKKHEPIEQTAVISEDILGPDELIGGLEISSCIDSRLHFFPTAFPIPYWSASMLEDFDARIIRRPTCIPFAGNDMIGNSMGREIAWYHHHELEEEDLNDGEPTCLNASLELMISCGSEFGREGAYLLKSVGKCLEGSGCYQGRYNDDDEGQTHRCVARLAGLPPLDNLSTLGLKIAVSPCANRIAISHWKTVNIYAIDPKAFLDQEYSIRDWEWEGNAVPGDHTFVEQCGWEFYKKEDVEDDCVTLEPVVLPSAGVVYGLEFFMEDEIWAWTDEGVVRWRFDVFAKGKRQLALLGESAGGEPMEF